MGWGKVCVLEHKSDNNISETREDREKLRWRVYSTIQTPYSASPSPKSGVCNPNPKLQSLLSQERVNSTDCKLGRYIHKHAWKIWEKRERRRIQELPKFLEYPLGTGYFSYELTSNLAGTFAGSIRPKVH